MNLIGSHLPLRLAAVALVALLGVSCSSLPDPLIAPPDPETVRLSILATPTLKEVIPPGARIVVANISGGRYSTNGVSANINGVSANTNSGSASIGGGISCSEAVKDALMRRLIENANYDVLSRDDLDWIMKEMEMNWSGVFDTQKVKEVGKLLGASYFVVGRVTYCGFTANTDPDSESDFQFSIFATLQIIDIESGKVVVASASEGNFVPTAGALATLLKLPFQDEEGEVQAKEQPKSDSPIKRFLKKVFSWFLHPDQEPEPVSEKGGDEYQVFRAAEDLANSFADDFFARSVWHHVEMWNDTDWSHSDAIHFVKLGDCPRALELIEKMAAKEIGKMDQREMSRYLHNYGVVLMCANKPDRAVDKLRSAYRLSYNKMTLRMLGIAQKIQEWSLRAEEDVQPEVDLLTDQTTLWRQN